MILQNTEPKLKVGPIQNRDGKAFGRRRLFENEVLFSLNSSPLSPNPGAKGYNADINGYYDIEVPGEYTRDPGVLSIVIQVDGHPTFKFDYKVEEEQEFARPGDIDVVIGKLNVLDSVMCRKEQFSGLSTAIVTLQNLYKDLTHIVIGMKDDIKYLDKEPTKCLAGGLDEKIGLLGKDLAGKAEVLNQISGQLEKNYRSIEATLNVNMDEVFNKHVVDVVKKEQLEELRVTIESLGATLKSIKPLKQKDITGHDGPLDTKNGRVRVAEGRDEGEIDLVNGQTLARDVADKTGWVLGASGFDVITTKIEQIVKKLIPGKKPNIKKRS